MEVDGFIKWLRRGGKRGRTMSQYVELFGDYPISTMLGKVQRKGRSVEIRCVCRGEACNHHRLILLENNDD